MGRLIGPFAPFGSLSALAPLLALAAFGPVAAALVTLAAIAPIATFPAFALGFRDDLRGRAQHALPIEREIRMRVLERLHHFGLEKIAADLAIGWRAKHIEQTRPPGGLSGTGAVRMHHKGGFVPALISSVAQKRHNYFRFFAPGLAFGFGFGFDLATGFAGAFLAAFFTGFAGADFVLAAAAALTGFTGLTGTADFLGAAAGGATTFVEATGFAGVVGAATFAGGTGFGADFTKMPPRGPGKGLATTTGLTGSGTGSGAGGGGGGGTTFANWMILGASLLPFFTAFGS